MSPHRQHSLFAAAYTARIAPACRSCSFILSLKLRLLASAIPGGGGQLLNVPEGHHFKFEALSLK
jgi:hypothetical protein